MENDLLTRRGRATAAEANGGFAEPEENRNTPNAVEAEPQYREIKVEPPQPPVRLTLSPPIEYDGQRYSELIFDFDKMIGKDFQRAERDFTRLYKPDKNEGPVLPEAKHLYHCILAAQVAGVPLGLIFKLPRPYYNEVRTLVLKACGSSPEETNQ